MRKNYRSPVTGNLLQWGVHPVEINSVTSPEVSMTVMIACWSDGAEIIYDRAGRSAREAAIARMDNGPFDMAVAIATRKVNSISPHIIDLIMSYDPNDFEDCDEDESDAS